MGKMNWSRVQRKNRDIQAKRVGHVYPDRLVGDTEEDHRIKAHQKAIHDKTTPATSALKRNATKRCPHCNAVVREDRYLGHQKRCPELSPPRLDHTQEKAEGTKRMRFTEIMRRLTGISAFGFGANWQPADSEVQHMRELLHFLEDRRVLYVPSEAELPSHCVESVFQIRQVITLQLSNFRDPDTIASLRAMRAACRKFVGASQDREIQRYGAQDGHWASWHFLSALGELRGVMGIHIAKLAAKYKIDVEDQLAAIFPAEDVEELRPNSRAKTARLNL